jgi:hypothetical protein
MGWMNLAASVRVGPLSAVTKGEEGMMAPKWAPAEVHRTDSRTAMEIKSRVISGRSLEKKSWQNQIKCGLSERWNLFATEVRFRSTDNIERDSTIVKLQANRAEKVGIY